MNTTDPRTAGSVGPAHAALTGPPVVHWAASAARYAALAADPELVGLPVRVPEQPARARLWRRVLATGYVSAPVPAPGSRLVLALGAAAAVPAGYYARRTGSALRHCADPHELARALDEADRPHLVVIAPAERLTVGLLARSTALAGRGGRRIGFLTGRDEAGLSFSVAKALLAPAPALSGVDLFDAPGHGLAPDPDYPPPALLGDLGRPALAKVLRTHGEGGHAKLPGAVVCGVLDEGEFPDSPGQGCTRQPRRCKRSGPPGTAVVFGDEIPAPVVGFLCCNGFNVAGELYPSPVSMALALVEGWAGAVLAPIRPSVIDDAMLRGLRDALLAGRPLGEVVAQLNAMSARIDQPDAFVLHGDPVLALPAAGAVNGAAAGTDPVVDDATRAELRDWLMLLLRGLERGRRLLRAGGAWLGGAAEPLVPLRQRYDQLERMAVDAVKWAERYPEPESWRRLRRTVTLIRLGVAQWDRAAARLALDVRETLDPYDLGHYDQIVARIEAGPACPRCGTPTELHHYGRGDHPDNQRLARMCLVCGPLTEHRTAGPALIVLTSSAQGTGGDSYHLRARLDWPAGVPRLAHSAQLYLRFFDKASGACVHQELRTVPAEDQLIEVDIALPERLGVDLHSIRLVAVSGFDLCYARVRFAGLPSPASQPAIAGEAR